MKEVHFDGTLFTNYIPIKKDLEGLNGSNYLAPQFKKHYPDGCGGNEQIIKQDPVAYVSGTKARVKAIFESNCNASYYIRGMGPMVDNGQIKFPPQLVTASNGLAVYDFRDSDIAFTSQKIKYWENFTIDWEISEDQSDWKPLGESQNTMYVTHGVPELSHHPDHAEPTTAFHTLLHLGCNKTNDETNVNTIVNLIYDQFKNKNINRADGVGPIQYWGPNVSNSCHYVSQMLVLLNGTCGGWSEFFEDILRLQGITNSEISTVHWNYVLNQDDKEEMENNWVAFFGNEATEVFPEYYHGPDANGNWVSDWLSQFFVKKWNFMTNEKFVLNEYDNIFHNTLPVQLTLENNNVIYIRELDGIKGQGNDDPRSEFCNHAIVKYNNQYYDPSYGSPVVNNPNAWKTQSLHGIGGMITFCIYNGGFPEEYYINWVKSTDVTPVIITP